MRTRVLLAAAFLAAPAPALLAQDGLLLPANLRCEYLSNPLGVDVPQPRLSWVLVPRNPSDRSLEQSAWEVLVADTAEALARDEGNLWSTGRVPDDRTIHIPYSGRPLAARQRAFWKVRVWDQNGRASGWSEPALWSAGLLSPQDWGGAQWIGDPTPPPPIVAANNGYHSEFAEVADATRWVQIDLGAARPIDAVALFPARPYDWREDVPGLMFPVRYRVDVSDAADFASFTTVADRTAGDVPNPGTKPVVERFAPTVARYVRLTATRLGERNERHFALALAEMEAREGDRAVSRGAGVQASDSIEMPQWSTRYLTDGDLVSHGPGGAEPQPAPMLRREFAVLPAADGPVAGPVTITRATLSITALGLYEARLNGQRVGERHLAPEWTDYHTRVQYQTYDVTNFLVLGDNAIGVTLADGWYAGEIGLSGGKRAIYGRVPLLLCRLDAELSNGQTVTVVSDGTWQSTREGPVRSADLMDGEEHDARREMPGWDLPRFAPTPERGWRPARVAAAPAIALNAQMNEAIRITRDLKPLAVTEPAPGVYVFDLGQNFAGWCRLALREPAGTRVTLRHAEVLNPDGTIYTANLRGAAATDRYTCAGRADADPPEVFEPRFTYHGFRYVEVTGLTRRPDAADLLGRAVHSAPPETGFFQCSDPMLTKLWQNAMWTQRANMHSTPTDCPQRDERMGWMGDILAFAPAACFNMDMGAFLTKWLRDVRDAQADDGRFPDFAPQPFDKNRRFTGVPAWGDAGVFVPWVAYRFYADTRLLEENYDAARRWVDWIRSKNPDLLWKHDRHNDYGDWLNADTLKLEGWPARGAEMPKDAFATAFFAESADRLSKIAAVLGRSEDARHYARLAADIRDAFNRAYVSPDGTITGDTQAGYAIALHFNLLPPELRERAAARMVQKFADYNGSISTGFHSTLPLMDQLTRSGRLDEAYRLLTNRTMPSWGYAIDHGATTIWERWDGYVEGRGFQDPGMNSFAHYALGAVSEWMIRTIAGIDLDPAVPAFKSFIIRPRPGAGLAWARASYQSVRGPIYSAWIIRDGRFILDVSVPPNTSATCFIPCADPERVTEGGQPPAVARGAAFLRAADGASVYRLGSGSYRFQCPAP